MQVKEKYLQETIFSEYIAMGKEILKPFMDSTKILGHSRTFQF